MDFCQQSQLWLLESDDANPNRSASNELAAHMKSCPVCGRLSQEIRKLEQAWREAPIPVQAQRAQAAFLEKINIPMPASPGKVYLWQRGKRHFADGNSRHLVRWAMAAVVLLSTGLSMLLLPAPQAQASPDMMERLIDWNLDLAQAQNPQERQRIYAEREPDLQLALDNAALTREDRKLGQTLLESGKRLAQQDDPLARVENVDDLADRFLERMNRAAKKGQTRDTVRFSRNYLRVMKGGLDARLEKSATVAGQEIEKKKRMDKLTQRKVRRLKELEAMLNYAPRDSKAEIRKSLEVTRPQPHRAKGNKGKTNPKR